MCRVCDVAYCEQSMSTYCALDRDPYHVYVLCLNSLSQLRLAHTIPGHLATYLGGDHPHFNARLGDLAGPFLVRTGGSLGPS